MSMIAVFCGSSSGSSSTFTKAAQDFGVEVAQQGIGLVCGGGKVGLMGTVADAALEAGGEVIGVIPRALVDRELAHPHLHHLHITKDMHERKAKMADLAAGFVALPGGAGTLEELFEVWTWEQLGYHAKPCGIYNVAGYFDKLLEFINHMVATEFLKTEYAEMLQVAETSSALIAKLRDYKPLPQKWG